MHKRAYLLRPILMPALWGTKGSDDGLFRAPVTIALDRAGNIYASDQANNAIQKSSLR